MARLAEKDGVVAFESSSIGYSKFTKSRCILREEGERVVLGREGIHSDRESVPHFPVSRGCIQNSRELREVAPVLLIVREERDGIATGTSNVEPSVATYVEKLVHRLAMGLCSLLAHPAAKLPSSSVRFRSLLITA